MPTPEQLRQMAAWLAGTDIGLLELRTPHGTVRLGRNGSPAAEVVQLNEPTPDEGIAPGPAPTVVTASSVGAFLHAHPLHDAPVVRAGERVAAGQDLGLLQIGPLLLPVDAPVAGRVTLVHVETGRTVGYGTPLFELRVD
jgi:acetyl-CoA carboxylase biotin carboxyl carrier protein